MEFYPNYFAQPAPIPHPHPHHHMNPVHPMQGGWNPSNGYGNPMGNATATPQQPHRLSHQQQLGNSYSRRSDNRQFDAVSSKTLWMGNIDGTMDEAVIQGAFDMLGIKVHNIKIIRNKDNGLPLGYGFVSFDDRNTAQEVLRDLNGKKIPNINDDKRFFLKRANRNGRFSVFVGNLPPQIDNDVLMNAFMAYYPSVSSAKVIMNDGVSKGFGFVSFDDENDYHQALQQQSMMLGAQLISVSKARHNNNNNNGNNMNGNHNPNNNHNNNNNNNNRRNFASHQPRDQYMNMMNTNNHNNNRIDLQFRQQHQQQQHY